MILDFPTYIQAKLCLSIDFKKLFSLFIGVVMIYTTFMVAGVIHEYVLKQQYTNRFDNSLAYFKNPQGLIVVEKTIITLCGTIYNFALLPAQKRTDIIPAKNSLICAFIMLLSALTNNYAIILVSYPIVTMFKSCNILPIILVGVICSRVKSKSLKLGAEKIIVAIIVTAGMVLFKIFDPQAKQDQQEKNLQILGIILLVISLVADGFLPDFQAQIKEKFKPQPTIMMVEIHKYCSLLSLIYCIVTGNFMPLIRFSWNYPLFILHLLCMSGLAFLGNIFVYRMIKDFRQHIGPFIITTRRIISVGISMIYFHHQSSVIQIICILVVLFTTLYEFLKEIIKSNEQENEQPDQMISVVDQELQQKNHQYMNQDQKDDHHKAQQKQSTRWRQKFNQFKK